MSADEGTIDVPGGRVWYRSVGEGGTPLLCLHGGPGFTHYYLESLEALGERRRVIFYDQLGCGRSDRPDDPSLWTVERFVEELAQVRAALGLDRLHLFGSSWGGMLAMQYVIDRRPPLQSMVLCGSPASMPRWVRDCEEEKPSPPASSDSARRADMASSSSSLATSEARSEPMTHRRTAQWPTRNPALTPRFPSSMPR